MRASVFVTLLALSFFCAPLLATTWYVRPDGGSRYSAKQRGGQCDGSADEPYPGNGVNRHCAFNDFRYLWDDQSYGGYATWVISGGDTVIVRGCATNHTQQNPSAPNCRIGWDAAGGKGGGYTWCYGGSAGQQGGPYGCYSPPVPSGTASQHTRILGANYANCSDSDGPKRAALAQLFGGFAVNEVLNVASSHYVDIECLELTSHNGKCTTHGSPGYPRSCSTNDPVDDFAANGIVTSERTANVTFQNLYIHGFNTSGIAGPIGGPIVMNRVFIGFNGLAGWNFDDGRNTPDGAGSSITATYVTMEGNGCDEQYPIVNTQFPAQACYDDQSGGFGDSWSGQDTTLDAFTCNHCAQIYNTKDGFIGPHTQITSLLIENSESIGNMGQQWKWGATPHSTTIFRNNITIGNCGRMSQILPGAARSFAQSTGGPGAHLSDFCRAAGDTFSFYSSSNSTVLFVNNTIVNNATTTIDLHCTPDGSCGSTPYIFRNNIMLGFSKSGEEKPGLYYLADKSNHVTADHNIYFNMRNTNCLLSENICGDPMLIRQPVFPLNNESDLDNLDFHPGRGSPAIHAGAPLNDMEVDHFNARRQAKPTIGAVEP